MASTDLQPPTCPPGGERHGATFDATSADVAVDFFPTYLRHTEAEWWGKPFILSPWQRDLVRAAFGWKRRDGTRLIRQVYLEVPRKNGKTEFAAGLALLMLLAEGEPGGQGYSMACDKEQASIVFNKACTMVQLSPTLRGLCETFKTAIFCPQLSASFKPLSSKPSSKHGFSPFFAIADELHEWPTGELHDVVHKGTGARRQPLEILITTAGVPGEGYGWQMHEYAQNVAAGIVEDPTFFPLIFAADPDDDWRSPETWAKANPNLGVSIKNEYLEQEVTRAQGSAHLIADFKRYHLNLWNSHTEGGLDINAWDACGLHPVKLEDLKGRRCYGALDLSSTTDLTALTVVAEREDGGFDAWWHFWIPTENLAERIRRDRVPFDRWIAEGLITATEGNVVDYDAIRAMISGGVEHDAFTDEPICTQIELAELAIDRWNATHLITQLMSDGVNVVAFGQGYASMSGPSKEFERLIGVKQLNHGKNPVARWMASCVTFKTDGAENIKPVKPDRRRSTKRIDGIVTLIMALARATAAVREDDTVPDIILL